ncbi:hypothetical protein E9993_01640 [Labilibacter sediminis]|nr:hypothetical protein E9993_01640 [Labilibacter sediminis]
MIRNKIKTISKEYDAIALNDLKDQLNEQRDYVLDDEKLTKKIKSAIDYCEGLIDCSIVPAVKSLVIYEFSGNEIVIDEYDYNSIKDVIVNGVSGRTDVIKYVVENYTYFTIKFNENIQADKIEIKYNAFVEFKENYKEAIIVKASDLIDNESSNYTYQVQNNKTVERLLNITT